jgi:hypothetical protein
VRLAVLLSGAAETSPRLGSNILPYLLQPLQEHRYTAQQLLDALDEQYPDHCNDPQLPDPALAVAADPDYPHSTVLIPAALQARSAVSTHTDPVDHDPRRRFESTLAVGGFKPTIAADHGTTTPCGAALLPPSLGAPHDEAHEPAPPSTANPDRLAAPALANVDAGDDAVQQPHNQAPAPVPDGTVNATPDPAVEPANHQQAGTDPSAAARSDGTASRKWDLARSLFPLAVFASAVGMALIPGVQQRATALMGLPLPVVFLSWPELDEPSPLPPDDRPWINCEKFDTLHCTPTSLANAVALSPSVDTRAAAAQTLKKCVESAWDYTNFIEFPPLIEVLTQRMWQGPFNSTRNSLDAASALTTLFPDASNRINETAAVPHITRLLSDLEIAVQELALNALRRIVHVPRIRSLVVAEGAAKPLVRLLRNGAVDVQETAAYVVGTLISSSEQNKVLFEHAGAIPALLPLLSGGSEAVKEAVAYALDQYAVASPSYQALITAGGAVHSLLQLLEERGDRAKRRAICGLTTLASLPENRKTLRDTKAFTKFLEVFRDGNQDLKWEVVEALKVLARETENVAPIREAGAVPLLTNFLTTEGCGSNPFPRLAAQESIDRLTAAAVANVKLLIDPEVTRALLISISDADNKRLLLGGSVVSQLIFSMAADVNASAGVRYPARNAIKTLVTPTACRTVTSEEAAMVGLLQHLTIEADEIRYVTVEALKEGIRDFTMQEMMVRAGVTPLLAELLKTGRKSYTALTMELLGALALDSNSKRLVVEAGAVPLMIQHLAENDYAVGHAAWHPVRQLITRTGTKTSIAAPEAIPMLLHLLSNGTDAVVGRMLCALQYFAEEVSVRETIAAAGVKPVLHQLLRRQDQIGRDASATIGAGRWW